MATTHNPSDPRTDLEYAIHLILAGQKDPEYAARVQAETAKITEETQRKHGVLNLAVDLFHRLPDRETASEGESPEIRPAPRYNGSHALPLLLSEAYV